MRLLPTLPLATALHALSCSAAPHPTKQTTCPWNPTAYLQPWFLTCRLLDDNPQGGVDSGHDNAAHPWLSYTPYCLTPSSAGKTDKLCVYSSPSFYGGAGISVVVTPEVAAGELAAAVLNPSAGERRLRYLNRGSAVGSTAAQAGDGNAGSVPYAVTKLGNRGSSGVGVVATRNISRYELVMSTLPAVVVDGDLFPPLDPEQGGTGMPPTETWTLFDRALAQLTDAQRVTRLAREMPYELHALDDVVRTNAFGVTIGGRRVKALYPEIARINHGCNPNTVGRFRPDNLVHDVIATRDIKAGEEIFISYIPIGLPYAHRQRGLRAGWHFDCDCPLCSLPPAARAESDARRYRLESIKQRIESNQRRDGNSEESMTHAELVTMADEMLDIVSQEGLERDLADYHRMLMAAFANLFKDFAGATKHGREALEIERQMGDTESLFYKELVEDLRVLEQAQEFAEWLNTD